MRPLIRANKTPGLEAKWASQREEEVVGAGREKQRKWRGKTWQGARLARGSDKSSIGRVRQYKPEEQIIDSRCNDTLTVVNKTDRY